MKKILLIIVSIVYAASASPLFERCSTCHGKKGEKHSLNLTRPIAGLKVKEIVKILKSYKAGTRNKYGFGSIMKGQTARLSDNDIVEVATYIESLHPVEITYKPKSEETSAEEIFKRCSICHGKKAEKKSLGVSRVIAGLKAKEIINILEEYRAGKRDSYGYGNMMRGQATKLSHKNIKAVAKYIESFSHVKSDDNKTQEPKKKISQQEVDYNTFMDAYFRDSKDPNETFEAANKAYEEHLSKEHLKKLKEKNE
ncbi:MAG: c-type cytochrome [Sulfurimonas sp.]|nr:c-type cytochrome [Sulfurimonas sp.]